MGRYENDGNSIDVTVPASTLVEKGELYRIEKFSGFAFDEILAAATERLVALSVDHSQWWVKVPSGTCGTRGNMAYWSSGTGFKKSSTDIQDTVGTAGDRPVAQVVSVRNAGGYALLKLCQTGAAV